MATTEFDMKTWMKNIDLSMMTSGMRNGGYLLGEKPSFVSRQTVFCVPEDGL